MLQASTSATKLHNFQGTEVQEKLVYCVKKEDINKEMLDMYVVKPKKKIDNTEAI